MLELAMHAGTSYTCPFCGYGSKDLLPIGHEVPVLQEKLVVGAGRRKAACYKCHSTDRERLIYVYLKDQLHLFDNKNLRILHMAPERNLSKVLHQTGFAHYICGDLFMDGYDYPAYVQNMNVLDIPFEDGYFDLVICNHLLEHVPNDTDAMKELHRVLKVDGSAIL